MADRNITDDGSAPTSPSSGASLPVGNKQYEQMLIHEGRMGFWFKCANASNLEAWAEIVPEVFLRSIHATTAGVLGLLTQRGCDGSSRQANATIDAPARSIIDAVCVMTYLKIQSVDLRMDPKPERYYTKPSGIPKPFEVPLLFAATVSQLGAVEVRSLTRRMVAAPAVPADTAGSWLLESK